MPPLNGQTNVAPPRNTPIRHHAATPPTNPFTDPAPNAPPNPAEPHPTPVAATATHPEDAVLDRIACAFAACASSEIPAVVQHALAEILTACGAERAALLSRDHAPLQAVANQPATTTPAAIPEDWIDQITARHHSADTPLLQNLPDWLGQGGVVCAWRLDADCLLALRWPETGPQGCTATHARIAARAGAMIAAALRRGNVSEERRNLLRRLSESQKLDVAGTTAVAMAHNLNNVLAAMLGHTEIALESLRDQPRGYNAVMSIRNASERAADLIESILGFGQRDVPTAQVSMGHLVAETIDLIRPAMPERITLSFEDASGEATVFGRPAELQQVLLNLLRNSAQAIPDHGRITVRIDCRTGNGRIETQIGALDERPYLVVVVEDSGVGIDPASHATIFRPFHTTRPAGSGLGLSTVADIVGAHDGGVHVRAATPHGTAFEIWLPRCITADGRSARGDGDGQPVVVVATEALRERFEDIVAVLGYEPEGFNTIDAALWAIANDPQRYCAIMLCTDRTDIDGCITVAERFRPVTATLPLTILMPGRMPATPLGRITDRQMWLAGSDNSSAIAGCMRLMANAAAQFPTPTMLLTPNPATHTVPGTQTGTTPNTPHGTPTTTTPNPTPSTAPDTTPRAATGTAPDTTPNTTPRITPGTTTAQSRTASPELSPQPSTRLPAGMPTGIPTEISTILPAPASPATPRTPVSEPLSGAPPEPSQSSSVVPRPESSPGQSREQSGEQPLETSPAPKPDSALNTPQLSSEGIPLREASSHDSSQGAPKGAADQFSQGATQ